MNFHNSGVGSARSERGFWRSVREMFRNSRGGEVNASRILSRHLFHCGGLPDMNRDEQPCNLSPWLGRARISQFNRSFRLEDAHSHGGNDEPLRGYQQSNHRRLLSLRSVRIGNRCGQHGVCQRCGFPGSQRSQMKTGFRSVPSQTRFRIPCIVLESYFSGGQISTDAHGSRGPIASLCRETETVAETVETSLRYP